MASTLSYGQDSLNMNKVGHLGYGNTELSDVWGYVDSAGTEYALVGTRASFSVVDLSTPSSPTEVFEISGAFSVWRDIKTWGNHAYVIHDSYSGTSDGILIVDLDDMDATPTYTNFFPMVPEADSSVFYFYTRSHNLYIDENGIMYIFGADIKNGGALLFDVTVDPMNPTYLGMWDDQYLHDGMVRGDTLWGGGILAGNLYAINVSNKSNPTTMGSITTPSSFTHNCWVSDDGKTVYTTDEKPNAFVASYDVTNLSNITELDRLQSSYGNDVIPHNTHVYGDFLVTSYYTSGLQIVDAEYPNNMVEVGYYDHSAFNGNTYNGSWGAYPYLPSGLILSTDIEAGLFVLSSPYVRASRFSGMVVDSVTGNPLPIVGINFTNSGEFVNSDLLGEFIIGNTLTSADTLLIQHPGYETYEMPVTWVSGQNQNLFIELVPENIGVEEWLGTLPVIYPNPSASGRFTLEDSSDELQRFEVYNTLGQKVIESHFLGQSENLILDSGFYFVHLISKSGSTAVVKIIAQ